MPMMRRGPLDRYPVDWVLRQASLQRASGTIEVHGDQAVAIYLDGGRVYAAHEVPGAEGGWANDDDEDAARAAVVEVLASVLGATNGWYYHDPLGHLPGAGSWSWEPGELLAAVQGRSDAAAAPAALGGADDGARTEPTAAAAPAAPPPPARTIGLCAPASTDGVRLSADAWAAVVALADARREDEVAAALGWDRARLTSALHDLVDQGLASLALPAPPTAPDAPAGDDRVVPFRAPSGRTAGLRRRRPSAPEGAGS